MAFQAYSAKHGNVTRPTAQEAATEFFKTHPRARKCNLSEGEERGVYFTTVRGGRSFRDVTKQMIPQLPN